MAEISQQIAKLQRMRSGRMQGEEARVVNVKGRQLIIRLNLLLRTSTIHEVHNEALQRSIDFLVQATNELLEDLCPLVLQGDQDQMYINDFRIRGDATVYANIRLLIRELKRLGCGGMSFHAPITRAEVLHLLEVLRGTGAVSPNSARIATSPGSALHDPGLAGEHLLTEAAIDEEFPDEALDEEGYLHLNAALDAAGVASITFNRYLQLGTGGDLQHLGRRDRVQSALKTYAKVLVAVKRVTSDGAELKALERLKIIKNIQALIDLCFDDEVFFEGLGSLKCDGDYAYAHPVHVAMLSIQMGKFLGFSRKLLMELALAALFYDLGRLSMSSSILNKAEELNQEEWDEVRRHPLRSAREALRLRTLNEAMRKRLLVAFEHHLGYKGGGYPQRIYERVPHLFSRIVAIADAYDALTTERPFRDGYLPAEALRIMMDDTATRFDPVLLRVLINILRIYPIGTMVLLDTREIAAVYHHQSDAALLSRPIVRVLSDGAGRPIRPLLANLGEQDGQARFLRTIVRTLDHDEARAFLPGHG